MANFDFINLSLISVIGTFLLLFNWYIFFSFRIIGQTFHALKRLELITKLTQNWGKRLSKIEEFSKCQEMGQLRQDSDS